MLSKLQQQKKNKEPWTVRTSGDCCKGSASAGSWSTRSNNRHETKNSLSDDRPTSTLPKGSIMKHSQLFMTAAKLIDEHDLIVEDVRMSGSVLNIYVTRSSFYQAFTDVKPVFETSTIRTNYRGVKIQSFTRDYKNQLSSNICVWCSTLTEEKIKWNVQNATIKTKVLERVWLVNIAVPIWFRPAMTRTSRPILSKMIRKSWPSLTG